MQNQLPIWVEYVRALGTPFAAIVFGTVAVWFSYRQWKISTYKYRFDLFDRRYKVYAAVQGLFGELIREDKISGEVYSRFAVAVNEAKFLFGDEIDSYLNKLTDNIFEKQSLDRKFSRQPSDDEFKKLSDQADRNWESITKMMNETKTIFSKYLKIPE